jgi:cyclase
VHNGRVVKGVNFVNLKDAGDPVEIGAAYDKAGADELVFLDITATSDARETVTDMVRRVAEKVFIPFTVGGGISSFDDAARLLDSGADKISINSSAIANPALIEQIATRYGSQFVICAIDAKCVDGKWLATTHGGRNFTDKELYSWALEAQERGAGEILFTSMDHDGTKAGYPCEVYARLCDSLRIPVIASGGAGNIDHIVDVLTTGKADAALAASIFHYNEIPIPELKAALNQRGISVRL